MIHRRSFISIATAGVAAGIAKTGIEAAQLVDTGLPLQNASFIRTPANATPVASPEAGLVSDELRGYILGDPDAANTLQLYADYRCPHCRIFNVDIEPELIEDFVESGRMNIEFLDFTVIDVPSFDALSDDSIESVQAAEAAACAAEQDAYLTYRDWLFDGPSNISTGDFSDDNLINAADNLGLNSEQFSESLKTGIYEGGIIQSVALGLERGVQGTPTMILNGGEPFYVPADGYPGLKTLLDSQLN